MKQLKEPELFSRNGLAAKALLATDLALEGHCTKNQIARKLKAKVATLASLAAMVVPGAAEVTEAWREFLKRKNEVCITVDFGGETGER